MRWGGWIAGLVFIAGAMQGSAHEVRPGYLYIQQLQADRYDLLFRVPARGEMRLGIDVQLPPSCERNEAPRSWQQAGAFFESWTATCVGGLAGGEVAIAGLSATLTDVLARFERLDGTLQVARLSPARPSFTVSTTARWQQIAATYFLLGMEHILWGIDHLLFVLALVMIVQGWRKLVGTVTAFTAAHSLSLAAATLGWVQVPQAPVEAVIALSILFVAAEIVHWRQGRVGLTHRAPWVVGFLFGLLHGLGFAGALAEIGLPEHAIPSALLFFNLGVEAGQLLFIACVLIAWSVLRWFLWPRWLTALPVYGIGAMAGFWLIARVAGF